MNFLEYKAFRERALKERNLTRLDCLNPFIAMEFTRNCQTEVNLQKVPDDALLQWLKAMRLDEEMASFMRPVEGVRAALHSMMRMVENPHTELWLPEDVYPFYWETARDVFKGKGLFSFPTMPEPDLSPLYNADSSAIAIITDPISPLGRCLTSDEVSFFLRWLGSSKDRLLVIDSVYAYDTQLPESTRALYDTGQVMVLHSLSKAWIQRAVFGVVLLPLFRTKRWQHVFEPPSHTAAALALQAFAQDPDLPRVQQKLFDREWERLAPAIREMDPDFQAEGNGYLRPIRINHLKAMGEFNAMVVPGTVFGSEDPNLSIVSCLYHMKSQYGSEF